MPRLLALPSRTSLWLALCAGLVCLLTAHVLQVIGEQEVCLALSITADARGTAYPKFIDAQGQFHGDRSLALTPGTRPHLVRALLPRGQFQGIYLNFGNESANVTVNRVWLRNTAGTLNREIPLDYDVRGLKGLEIQSLPAKAGIAFHLTEGTKRAGLAIRVPGESIGHPPLRWIPSWTAFLAGLTGGALVLLLGAALKSRGYDLPGDLWRLAGERPRTAIILIGAASALVSVLPVFTDHRGFIGPYSGGYIFYEAEVSVPGQGDRILPPMAAGVDVGAVLFTALGYMKQASQHLWQDHEIMLWDRFSNGGVTYVGEGMFLYFSPFMWIVLLLGGTMSSWTWAFIAAKIVFPITMALYLRRIGVSLQVALGAALACGFVGSFIYRTGHFAFFVAGAFPLVLLGLDGVLEPGTKPWKRVPYFLCWLLGCFACFSSGALKEGVFVIFTCNALALSLRLVAVRGWRIALNYLLLALGLTITFILLAAPAWMPFLATLGRYSSIYDAGYFLQKPAGSMLSSFDEFFGRVFSDRYAQFTPGLNLLFLPGFLFAIAGCVLRLRLRQMLIPVLGSLVCLFLVYSIIPGGLVVKVKFLSNIFTFYDTFGLTSLPLLIVASARGWDLWLGLDGAEMPPWFTKAGYGGLAGGVVLFSALPLVQATKRDSPLYLSFGILLVLAVLAAPLLLRSLKTWKSRPPLVNGTLLVVLMCICSVSWVRYAYHTSTAFVPWLFVLPERVDGGGDSTACDWLRQQVARDPARVVGIDKTFWTGTNIGYGLEGVGGAMPLWIPNYHFFISTLPGCLMEFFWTLSVPSPTTALAAPYLEFLNCRYLVCMPGLNIPGGGPPPVHRSDLEVRVLPLAWPRAFFIDQLEIVEDLPGLAARIARRTGPFCSIKSTDASIHSKLAGLLVKPGETRAKPVFTPAHDYALTLNSTSFTVEATGPGMLVLHETFDPGVFHVTLNGRAVEPMLVNQMFRGLYVSEPGIYRVEYCYWPPALTRGLQFGMLGLSLLLVLCAGGLWFPRVAA